MVETGNIYLPPIYEEAIRFINETAKRSNTRIAIVGSLGVAVSTNGLWEYQKTGGKPDGTTGLVNRDLDYIVLGSKRDKTNFQELLTQRSMEVSIDPCDVLNSQIQIENGEAHLTYGHVDVPIRKDLTLFDTYDSDVNGVNVSVLHPLTHFHLIACGSLTFRTHKVMRRARDLWQHRNSDDFPYFPEPMFEVFHEYHKEILRAHPLRYRILKLRSILYSMESSGDKSLLIQAKVAFREHAPAIASTVRKFFSF